MKPIKVLDHGFVRLIETWGFGNAGESEAGIIEAARQSTQGSFRGWEADEKLLRTLYLSNPKHATPFEFAGMIIEVQAPIFVFREWHRHRTQSYNEASARYAPLPDVNYLPTPEELLKRSLEAATTKNRQAGGSGRVITLHEAQCWVKELEGSYMQFQDSYDRALSMGVPKELARIGMPVGRYSKMRASTNLRNWLAFLTLRKDPMAQWEIRQYANAVGILIMQVFPHTYALFEEERNVSVS